MTTPVLWPFHIMSDLPSLKSLHPDASLSRPKLAALRKASTAALKTSLMPGQEHSLKVRPDGTMLDGHHRIRILRERGENVDILPREVIERGRM